MSAFLSCETSRSIVILTDGATYDPDHKLLGVCRKIVTSDMVPLAIAARGLKPLTDGLAAMIIEFVEEHGFDMAMRGLEALLPGYAPERWDGYGIEMLIAGVSEAHGLRHLTFCNIPNYGLPALQLRHPGPTFCAASSGERGDDLDDIGVRPPRRGEGPEDYLADTGVTIFQYFRESPVQSFHQKADTAPGFIVGGQLDLTVVEEAGVRTRTIHRWDDKIGERIDPFADRRAVVQLSGGLNRQQRRAGERSERKRLRA